MSIIFAPFFVVFAFASLLPFVGRDIVHQIMHRHFWVYVAAAGAAVLPVIGSEIFLQLLCMALILGAVIDRFSAYAPDGIVVPILAGSVFMGEIFGSSSTFIQIGAVAFLYVAAECLWALQVRLNKIFITSADILALISPLLFFGLSAECVVFNPLLVLCLIAVKNVEFFRRVISHPDAVKDAMANTNMEVNALGVTLLTIAYPVFYILLVTSEYL